ncbi:transglutaminase family protein [Marinobacterium weihaiense]|uniref:DUF3488 and transglutaminase-like domain-containing protein n=1 Tax=Marinobacterium weihaiense TaxID=2851016 RepID=A0ABS6M7K2_9GAMM|nr:DUF3488 and transglutaminase-like domain-containing protein [Marinobacterium weihaiense]MBV0932253.1 DUF3488 and transglutaminase-like domain-containing protein [Marinobacterium weihaiense]
MKSAQISRTAVALQLVAVLLAVVPHVTWLPLWVLALLLASTGSRLMIHSGRWPFPHWLVKAVLVAAASIGLILSFNHRAGPESMVALLIVALSLKLLEVYHRRDAFVVLFVCLFVAATSFLFDESFWMALYILAVTLLILAALNSIQQGAGAGRYSTNLKTAAKLLLPAVPFMLVLFFLFPRLDPLWSVRVQGSGATTGLSDELSPGDIESLAQSSALAFRATFEHDEAPPPEQRYWRALVMSEFDGRRWTRPDPATRQRLRPEKMTAEGAVLEYSVVMEPSGRPWLVALDQPLAPAPGMALSAVRTLQLDAPLERRRQYELRSSPAYRLQPLLTAAEQRHYLQLPRGGNLQSRALARQLQQQAGGDPQALIRALMQRFNRSYVYTLEPGRLGRDSVDAFLFDTQQGYCEHFASATAFVLRSAGIPARVVTGYQGGEWNPYERYIQVRQYDAHAWVEAWLPGQGWRRLDPTAAVAPERIRMSAGDFFDTDQTRFGRAATGLDIAWLRTLSQRYDAFNFAWHRWVLNYQGEQSGLLEDWLGGSDTWRLVLAWLLPTGVVFGLVAWWQLRPRRVRHPDPLERQLQALQQALQRLGWGREPAETVSAWLTRLADEWPSMRAEMQRLAWLDEQQRYAGECSHDVRGEMLQLCRRLRQQLPRKRSV